MLVCAAAVGCVTDDGPSVAEPRAEAVAAARPLASWNDGPARTAILEFVERVTAEGSHEFVRPEDRVAVFDNDGTLWQEQPAVQLAFTLDRVKELAPLHPEWRETQPFKAALEDDVETLGKVGEQGIAELLAATHVGNTTEEFERVVETWIEQARHPKLGVRYTELTYQPMLELLRYLEDKGFKTFVVSGGGVEFMRPWIEAAYGIPKERVIGSRAKVKYDLREGKPVLFRLPEAELVNDGAGKPVGIHQLIGRRPIAAFGNSDGDYEMLEWTTSAPGPRFGMLIHHTDGAREFAYDRHAHVGKLARALDDARARGWVVVDMRKAWNVVFPPRR